MTVSAPTTTPPTILALECSTAVSSVALRLGQRTISRSGETASATIDHVLAWCAEVQREAGIGPEAIDALAVGMGPGAFTGVRVAISVAQGLALAWDRRVIPVSSLAALAFDALQQAASIPALVLMDARMDEVYAGVFAASSQGVQALGDEQVLPPEQLASLPGLDGPYRVLGNGYALHRARIESVLSPPDAVIDMSVPTAMQVAALAAVLGSDEALPPHLLEPAYVRNKVALTTAERMAAARGR